VTPSVVVAAAYAEVLAAWSKSRWFTLNVTVGDRLPVHPDVASVVGDFTSLVLLEVDFREAVGFGERVRGLQRQLWRDLEHRAFGGVRVLRELARLYGVGRAVMPVVFTSVVGRRFGGVGGVVPGLGRVVSMVSQTPQVLLDHQIYERADGLVVSWDAVEEAFPAGLLDEAFAAYEGLLRRLADDPAAWDEPRLINGPDASDAETYARHQPARVARVAPTERVHTSPATPVERILVDIWANLLGLDDVSTTDNLFELGADSLLALRAVADADARGLKIDLREVFAHPTVREQAARARAVAGGTEQAAVSGETALTPSQHWFLSQDLPERHHWNDASFLLSLQRPLDPDVLRRSLRQILAHHDALRLRFRADGGTWTGDIAAPDPDAELPFSVHDFAGLTGPQQKRAVTEVSDALQRSLNLADGPLIRVAYFDLGQRPHCLLLLAHWLVVDHYSSRVLLEDLLACYRQYAAGAQAATLPGRTTPFPVWAAALAERARGAELLEQLPYWTDPARRQLSPLYLDNPSGANTLESLETITLRLDHDVTEAVLRGVPRAFGTDIATVLCTALVRSLPVATTGERRVLVDLERHGRDLELPGLDISRTVGRFSTIAPVMLELDHRADVTEALSAIGRQLAEVPEQGYGYGLLRYLSEHADQLRRMPPAQVGLNYVGQVDELFLRSDLLSVPRMSYGEQRSRVGTRFRPLDVLGYVVGRRLSFTIGYSTNLHTQATAERFAADFRAELEGLARRAAQH
jgi:non-ribosomal peptide synthase protein (TIGR01720 family)